MHLNEQDTERRSSDQPDLVEQLPDDLDPHDMADSIPDELLAEEGQEAGLDPDLAVFVSREELGDEDEP